MTPKEYLQTQSLIYNKTISQEERDKAKEAIVKYNKELIKEYPFLLPRNRFTDEPLANYDYTHSELDAMPDGWRIRFGDDMMKELKEELVKFDFLDKFRIMQIKEKYGLLRFYIGPYPVGSSIDKIIDKYEKMSGRYCMICGGINRYVSTGRWEIYSCEDCISKYNGVKFEKVKD